MFDLSSNKTVRIKKARRSCETCGLFVSVRCAIRPHHPFAGWQFGFLAVRLRIASLYVRSLLVMREHSQQQQGHDVSDLDHRVDRRSSSVLVRIANRITGNGRFMGF